MWKAMMKEHWDLEAASEAEVLRAQGVTLTSSEVEDLKQEMERAVTMGVRYLVAERTNFFAVNTSRTVTKTQFYKNSDLKEMWIEGSSMKTMIILIPRKMFFIWPTISDLYTSIFECTGPISFGDSTPYVFRTKRMNTSHVLKLLIGKDAETGDKATSKDAETGDKATSKEDGNEDAVMVEKHAGNGEEEGAAYLRGAHHSTSHLRARAVVPLAKDFREQAFDLTAPSVPSVTSTPSLPVFKKFRERGADMTLHVLTFNRPESVLRLIKSLRSAEYPEHFRRVDLIVHVDFGGLREPAHRYVWSLGNFTIVRARKKLGLLGQWINAWTPRDDDGDDSIHVILEDDMEMSRDFAAWFYSGHEVYAADDSVVAVTGQRPQLRARGEGSMSDAIELLPTPPRAVLYRLMATWSWSPKKKAWMEFLEWYKRQRASNYVPRVPNIVPDLWYDEFLRKGVADVRMWEMWVIAWMAQRSVISYCLYAWLPNATTVAANHRERGQNYLGGLGPDHELFDAAWTLTRDHIAAVPRLDWDGLPIAT